MNQQLFMLSPMFNKAYAWIFNPDVVGYVEVILEWKYQSLHKYSAPL